MVLRKYFTGEFLFKFLENVCHITHFHGKDDHASVSGERKVDARHPQVP